MRWRVLAISILLVLPVAVMSVAGFVALWRSAAYVWLWWLLPVCWIVAWLLARTSRRKLLAAPNVVGPAPNHFTPRDTEAWQLVAQRQQNLAAVQAGELADPHFYLNTALEMAEELGRHYHGRAADPLGALTVKEVLAAAQLALADTALWVDTHVPGSHLITVAQWRSLGGAPLWLRRFSNASWLVSIVANPLNVGRYVVSKFASDAAGGALLENARGWMYSAFVRHVGRYLIEMHSGRLQGGVERYRQFQAELAGQTSPAPVATRLALVGQVKAGKSSLANALLGTRQAAVDVLPETRSVARYTLELEGAAEKLVLFDTPGYAEAGATSEVREEILAAAQQADVLLLVLNATQPARAADAALLADLQRWFAARPQRKPPLVLGVLTHIDGQRPVLEWQPPYDWRRGTGEKERNIAAAVAYVRECLGPNLADVVPVCTGEPIERRTGVPEELVPRLIGLLDEGRACALVRTLAAELSREQAQLLVRQLKNAALGGLSLALSPLAARGAP